MSLTILRRSFVAFALSFFVVAVLAFSQPLTPAQLAAIKADIIANSDLNSQPNTADGAFEIARLYNLQASPAFTVWKTLVSISDVGAAFNGTELGNLTTANTGRLTAIAAFMGVGIRPYLADQRQMFSDIFSTGGVTSASLQVLWKRLATRIEKLFATGTGSNGAPATLVLEGQITYQEVQQARNS